MVIAHFRFSNQPWLAGACLVCRQTIPWRRDFCEACRRALPRPGPACLRCGAELPAAAGEQAVCGQCQRLQPRFHRTFALYRYAPPVDHLIQRLKYGGELHLSRVLGQQLAAALGRAAGAREPLARADLIAPVPLHRSRLRRRGFNQALEIARPVARALDLPLDRRHLKRVLATRPQAQLPLKDRPRNVRRAFVAESRAFDGKRVALVDDVMTSGHTADAAARALRRAGAQTVVVWVVARAQGDAGRSRDAFTSYW